MSKCKARHIERLEDYALDFPGAFLRVERRFWMDGTSCLSIMKYGKRKSDGVVTSWFRPQYTQLPWELTAAFSLFLWTVIQAGADVEAPKVPYTAQLGDMPLDLPHCFMRFEKEWKKDGSCWLWIVKYGPRPSDGLLTAWDPPQYTMIPWVLAGGLAAMLAPAINLGDLAVIPEKPPRRKRSGAVADPVNPAVPHLMTFPDPPASRGGVEDSEVA